MQIRKIVGLALFGLSVARCASSRSAESSGRPVPPESWADAVASRGVDPASVPAPMASTPEMDGAARRLAGPGSTAEKLARLQQALVDRREFRFERETGGTFTAIEAFRERRGNCVSFTNLFIAMGRSLGIPLEASIIARRPESEKHGAYVVLYTHMVAVHRRGNVAQVYDFWGQGSDPSSRLVGLDDLAVAGIQLANRGVDKLHAGDTSGALSDFDTAVRLAPRLPGVWANLGLARWRSADAEGALAAFRRGLEIDPGSVPVLQNLAVLYVETGRTGEGRAAVAAGNSGEVTPYTLIARGDLELACGRPVEALRVFKRAGRMAPKLVEPHVGIARAERARGRLEQARKAALRAQRLAPTDADVAQLVRELSAPDPDPSNSAPAVPPPPS